MNWKQIKEDNPKAWEVLRIWRNDGSELGMDLTICNITQFTRDLYDFFDSNSVRCFYNEENELVIVSKKDVIIYSWNVKEERRKWNSLRVIYDYVFINSRKEAEIILFTKAFSILEEQLLAKDHNLSIKAACQNVDYVEGFKKSEGRKVKKKDIKKLCSELGYLFVMDEGDDKFKDGVKEVFASTLSISLSIWDGKEDLVSSKYFETKQERLNWIFNYLMDEKQSKKVNTLDDVEDLAKKKGYIISQCTNRFTIGVKEILFDLFMYLGIWDGERLVVDNYGLFSEQERIDFTIDYLNKQ